MKILINAISAKKYSGGAFQITQNYLLKSLEDNDIEWYYIISQDVHEIIGKRFTHLNGVRYFVFPTQPDFWNSYWRVRKEVRKLESRILPDVVYSITAPSYFHFNAPEVMRFTNPWVTHPNKYSWATLSLKNMIRQRLYCWNQRRMMREASFFVTQTETTKRGIVRITGVPEKNVCVVKNVLPQIFKALPRMPQLQEKGWIDIACVGAPVPHKNFEIIPDLLVELRNLGLVNVRFMVTIPQDSDCWKAIKGKLQNEGLEEHVISKGRCSQIELAELYRHCQLCLLPTLLEVFSASTLEAMYFQLPIVATDFGFNREVMEDAALYYEPMNARDAATRIKEYIGNQSLQQEMVERMNHQLSRYDNYDMHFHEILAFLKEVAEKS